MNGTLFAAALPLVLALGACADSPAAATTSQGPVVAVADGAPPKQICHRERPTGSDIPVTVCRSVDDDSENAKNVDAVQRQVARDAAVAGAQHAATLGH